MLLSQSHPYLVHSFCWDSAERWSCLILSASLPPPAAELALVFGICELFVAVIGASHCAVLCSSNQARSRRHPVFGMIYLKHVSVLSWPGALWKRKGNSALRSKWKCSLSWWDGGKNSYTFGAAEWGSVLPWKKPAGLFLIPTCMQVNTCLILFMSKLGANVNYPPWKKFQRPGWAACECVCVWWGGRESNLL